MSMLCDTKFCRIDAKYIAQSPKEKLYACHIHLSDSIDLLTGIEFFVVKVKDVDP